MSGGTLVIGASQAGVQIAVSLRDYGDKRPITLAGAEAHQPYQRPPLSKAFLAGRAEVASLDFRTTRFYEERRIDVVCGERVTELRMSDGGPHGAGVATTDRGRVMSFDRLALAVGARPKRLPVPGVDLDGVFYLRAVEDSIRLRDALAAAEKVVVIGGGFIGLEVAAVARSQGKDVTVVEAVERLISRSVAPVVSEFFRDAHTRRGTRILLGSEIVGVHGENGRVASVDLADGTRLHADLVLVGVGIQPRTELAEQIGLAIDDGIVVDEFARASRPSVVAAGDCTVMPNPLTGEGRVRLESVQNAVSQARVAAATLAGRTEPYTAVPWFWSDQYDLKLQVAGLASGYDDFVVRGDPNSETFSVLYYRGGVVRAIDSVNNALDYLAVRKALGSGATIPIEAARDTVTPLKNSIVDAAPVTDA